MQLLSINFGHDASLALVKDGEIAAFLEIERVSRIKHTLGVTSQEIEEFLAGAGTDIGQIDLAAISSTQLWGANHTEDMHLRFGYEAAHGAFLPRSDAWDGKGVRLCHAPPGAVYAPHLSRRNITGRSSICERIEYTYPFFHGAALHSAQMEGLIGQHVQLLAMIAGSQAHYRALIDHFVTPCALIFKGKTIPAFHVAHHFAHAAYGHYYAATPDSLIVSHDGGLPSFAFNSGGIYASLGNKIVPLFSHKLPLGYLYDQLSFHAGFDEGDGAGKLMGLAPYGFPSAALLSIYQELLHSCLAQTPYDRTRLDGMVQKIRLLATQDPHIRQEKIKPFRFDFSDRNFSIAVAANTQKLVEDTFAATLAPYLNQMLDRLPQAKSVGIVGGFALNCPANTRLQSALGTAYVNPLPGAIDTGISIGAAVAVMSLLGTPLTQKIDSQTASAAFPAGSSYETGGGDGRLQRVETGGPLANFLGAEMAKGKIVCLLRGRSEIGPRALGRRSILAKASDAAIRDRINAKKGRENWRPLAPMCRKRDFSRFFSGNADTCRFMLFTYPVINSDIPGVTHVDGTARVQVIDEGDALLNGILAALEARGEPPVIINTSFNVAGEPIVETPEHAINSFAKLGFDYLVIEDAVYRVRAPQAALEQA